MNEKNIDLMKVNELVCVTNWPLEVHSCWRFQHILYESLDLKRSLDALYFSCNCKASDFHAKCDGIANTDTPVH